MNKLDEAKLNLKKTVEKLENSIDRNLIHAKNTPALEVMNKVKGLQEEVDKLSHDVDDKKDEITYLREQNSELQAKIGEEQHKTFQMEAKNRETAHKVDQVINKVQTYLVDKGLI